MADVGLLSSISFQRTVRYLEYLYCSATTAPSEGASQWHLDSGGVTAVSLGKPDNTCYITRLRVVHAS